MSTKFNMVRDINGYNGFGITPTYDVYGASLVASTAASITVPVNHPYWIAIFSYSPGTNVWVRFGGTASVPGGSSFSLVTSSLNPSARIVAGGTTISCITTDTDGSEVSVEFQIVPPYVN